MHNRTPEPFQPDDRVRLAEHLVPHFDGQTHGTVVEVVGTRYQDVQVNVGGRVYWFAATDLTLDPLPELPQRIRGATLTPSYIDAGDEPEPSNLDEYRCPEPGCDFNVSAAGPVDIDEPDPFQEEVDAHRRSHEPDVDAERPRIHYGWGDVSAIDVWLAVGDFHQLFNVLASEKSPADVANVLRRLADVLDGAR